MSEQEERDRVVKEALSFIGTPYRECARLKGGGVDCLTLVAECFVRTGLIEEIDIPPYNPQWHLHRDKELYIEGLLEYTREIFTLPQAGDIAMWKFARTFSHGALVLDWPEVIHSLKDTPVHQENAERCSLLKFDTKGLRPVRFFSFWGR